MIEKETRISVNELLDIIGYYEGKEFAEKMKIHYRRYNDYARIKDTILKSAVSKNYEITRTKATIRILQQRIVEMTQTDAFPKNTSETKPKP